MEIDEYCCVLIRGRGCSLEGALKGGLYDGRECLSERCLISLLAARVVDGGGKGKGGETKDDDVGWVCWSNTGRHGVVGG